MILYELRCGSEHAFDGWFRGSAGYDEQRAAGEIICPVCGTSDVSKAPMAPAVAKTQGVRPAIDPMTVLRAIRREVEAKCENVGAEFAEEARRIHYGEAEPRGIFGDSTPEESAALADEGIDVIAIPWVPANDS